MKLLVLFNVFFFVFSALVSAQEAVPPLPQPPSQVGGDAVPGFEQLEPDVPKALPAVPTVPATPGVDPHLKKRNTWTPEGSKVAFGDPNGELVLRGFDKDNPSTCAPTVNPVCAECWKQQLHPWLWQDQVDAKLGDDLNAELLWFVSGSYEDLEKELEKEGGDHASFVWLELNHFAKKHVVISLESDGIGMLRVYQGEEQLVAQVRCSSGDRTQKNKEGLIPQPNPGEYTLKRKATETDNNGIKAVWSKSAKCWMKWALCLDPDRAIFVHAGSLVRQSAGCIHVSFAAAPHLYNFIQLGSTFKVEWVADGASQEKPPEKAKKQDRISA